MFDINSPTEHKRSYLEACGFIVGPRSPNVKPQYAGSYMVMEDPGPGEWCIVGDNLDALIEQAFKVWFDVYEEAKNAERALYVAGAY